MFPSFPYFCLNKCLRITLGFSQLKSNSPFFSILSGFEHVNRMLFHFDILPYMAIYIMTLLLIKQETKKVNYSINIILFLSIVY